MKIRLKMKKTQLLQSAFMAASMLLMASEVMATPPGGGGGAGAPIDGGITLLLGAGASYSIKKLRDKKSN